MYLYLHFWSNFFGKTTFLWIKCCKFLEVYQFCTFRAEKFKNIGIKKAEGKGMPHFSDLKKTEKHEEFFFHFTAALYFMLICHRKSLKRC